MPDPPKRKLQVIEPIQQQAKRVRKPPAQPSQSRAAPTQAARPGSDEYELRPDDLPDPVSSSRTNVSGPTTKRPAIKSAFVPSAAAVATSIERCCFAYDEANTTFKK